tara:strand:+ start:368 stop:1669 length:1302 start_codon:yes stop_codon:yes gene_type:complete
LKKIPSLLVALTSLALIFSLWHPSTSPDVYIFSYFRLFAIMLCLSSAIYFFFSLKLRILLNANNLVFCSIVFGLLLTECLLRLKPSLIADNQLSLLPFSAGQKIANQRGLLTESNIIGKGTMFHMKPGVQLPSKPWVKIDSNGFYNNVKLGKDVDVVLLGASVLDARAAKKNVADMFYEEGSSAYSLAQGGPYSPFHFRDAYQSVIINQNVAHRYVVILIILPNEFNKIHQYKRIIASGGDYRDLFHSSLIPDIFPEAFSPWTLSIILKFLNSVPNIVRKMRRFINEEYAIVRFRNRTLEIPTSELIVPKAVERWQDLGVALNDIFKDAASHGAKPLVVYYPLKPILSIPYIEGHEEAKRRLKRYYEITVSRLESQVLSLGGKFLDVTSKIRDAQFKEDIMIAQGEYHLNQSGVNVLYSIIRKRLDEMGLSKN